MPRWANVIALIIAMIAIFKTTDATAKADGILSRALNQIVYSLTFLLAQGIAKDAAQQTNIFPQWRFLVGRGHALIRGRHFRDAIS